MTGERKPVRTLPPEVARKIAAGEVIDRPNAIVRELLDNAVDSGADSIVTEITGGGIDCIRVADNGSGMTKEDLENCARPHATSKITSETDLMNLSTLGFRGEALSSIAAVSRLRITSACEGSAWRLEASVVRDHLITPADLPRGTVVQSEALFENFPARRMFLKRPAAEALMCRQTFVEKALPRTDISFHFVQDGKRKLDLPKGQTLAERFTAALDLPESPALFYELHGSAALSAAGDAPNAADNSALPSDSVPNREDDAPSRTDGRRCDWKFTIIIGEPAVSRQDKKLLFIYVNGRRINEYSLMQAIEYGAQGYFPNGTHPAAALFLEMDPALVDFNIHPAKREARFKDIAPVHRAVSATVRDFFRSHTVAHLAAQTASYCRIQPELEARPETVPADGSAKFFSAASAAAENAAPAADFAPQYGAHSGDAAPSGASDNRRRFFRDSFGELEVRQSEPAYALPGDGSAATYGTASHEPSCELPHDGTVHGAAAGFGHDTAAAGVRYIGTALGVFLAAEKDGNLYLIDQHAAHERILYNAFIAQAGRKQALLVPYVVETADAREDEYLHSIGEQLDRAGFEATDCGGGRWEFSAVPIQWKGTERDLAADLLAERIAPAELIASLAATSSCRAAVKDGDVLDADSAQRLAEQALALSDPHCPHGRPLWKKISREELFAAVKRT